MAGASFTPDIIWEDPYFNNDPERPLTRREAVLWIAKHIRREDNCVTKKGELDASLRFLADKWNWAKTTVERFLRKLEKLGILVLKKCKIGGTVQYVISYCFSTLSAFSTKSSGTAGGTAAGQERDKAKSRKSEEKEDSPISPQGGQTYDGGFPGDEETAGADTSEIPPEPSEVIADIVPPNSAAPPSRKPRAKREAKPKSVPPLGWRPRPDTVKLMMEERAISDRQVEAQAKHFVDSCHAKNREYVEFDSAFRSWLRGPYFKLLPEPQLGRQRVNFDDVVFT